MGLLFARLSKHCKLDGMPGICTMSGNAFVHTVSESSALLHATNTHALRAPIGCFASDTFDTVL
jgi:hypothetical protein